MSSTDLIVPFRLVSPTTGEVLTQDSPTADLGRFLADVRVYESEIREAKKAVTRELLSRFDRQASWTHRTDDGLKLTAQSPAPGEEWNELELREALLVLVDRGVLTAAAVDAAVEPVVTYKVRKAGVNALRKLGGEVAEVVNAHARTVEKDRYVSVSRAA